MNDLDPDFDFLLGKIETSRLPHHKAALFTLMLLDTDPEEVSRMAEGVRNGKQTVEILALTSLTSGHVHVENPEGSQLKRTLTYEELMIQDASLGQR